MQTLFDPAAADQIARRLDALTPGASRQWGRMSPAQTLEHLSRALEMAMAKKPVKQAFIGKAIGWIFRKDFLGEKPFPKNGPTGPDFIVKEEPDFAAAKAKTQALLRDFCSMGERGVDGHVHGFFGPLTGAEWGVTQHKHLDHHLRQFGC